MTSPARPNFDAIINELKTVMDPDLKKDLVTLSMIRDLTVSDTGVVSLRVVLTTPACPVKELLKSQVEQAAQRVAGVTAVHVTMDAEVKRFGAQSRATEGLGGITHVIAVSSGKGEIEKSTVSTNLACALAKAGAKVGILDADIYGPNLPTMMGVTENPKLVKDDQRGEMFIPPVSYGVKVMSMGFLLQGDQPVIWRGPMLHNILNQFCTRVEWGNLDYLVIDLPPGTGDVQLSLAQMLPITGTVLVTTPQEIALQDVRKAFGMWEKVNVPVLGIVENMSWFTGDDGKQYKIFGDGGGESLARKFNSQVIAKLPLIPVIREGGDLGKPLATIKLESNQNREKEAQDAITLLASRVAQEIVIRDAKNDVSRAGPEIGNFA